MNDGRAAAAGQPGSRASTLILQGDALSAVLWSESEGAPRRTLPKSGPSLGRVTGAVRKKGLCALVYGHGIHNSGACHLFPAAPWFQLVYFASASGPF